MAYTESRNFQRSLKDLLGLPSGATIGACLQQIRQLLDRWGCPAAATDVVAMPLLICSSDCQQRLSPPAVTAPDLQLLSPVACMMPLSAWLTTPASIQTRTGA